MDTIQELKKDIAELEQLLQQASRTKVKDVLTIELRKLQTDLVRRQAQLEKDQGGSADLPKPAATASSGKPRYTKEINTYAWDQSDKFMKIYVTLEKVDSIPAENITVEFTNRTSSLHVQDLNGCNYKCSIGRFYDNIEPSESYHKVKKDMVLLMLKKSTVKKTWAYVTEREAKAKEAKPDKEGDPQDNLMSMLKNMYEEGDDEMKRTIAEAWSKSSHQAPM